MIFFINFKFRKNWILITNKQKENLKNKNLKFKIILFNAFIHLSFF